MTKKSLFALGLAFLCAVPANAHHSFAMFDFDKTVTLQGVIKKFDYSNPHTWIDMVVTDAAGNTDVWGFEAGATNTMHRQGWTAQTLKPGDKVTLEFHPMRNGTHAGSMVKVTREDGQTFTMGAQGARPDMPQ